MADLADLQFVTTGQVITTLGDDKFVMGHGTMAVGRQLIATITGYVERVNKLLSVRPVNSRYTAEVGDVVVGRVVEVADGLWRVDINTRQHAVLQLSSINLPGGVQRRRTYEDKLQMSRFFREGDLICAEVHKVQHDGQVNLHFGKSDKYGLLGLGQFLRVPSGAIRRSKQHYHELRSALGEGSIGVDIILGTNGYIWVAEGREQAVARWLQAQQQQLQQGGLVTPGGQPQEEEFVFRSSVVDPRTGQQVSVADPELAASSGSNSNSQRPVAGASSPPEDQSPEAREDREAAEDEAQVAALQSMYRWQAQVVAPGIRERICRVRGAVLACAQAGVPLYEATVMEVYDESIRAGIPPKAMLQPQHLGRLTRPAIARHLK